MTPVLARLQSSGQHELCQVMAIALIWLTYRNNGKNSATRMKCSRGRTRELSKYWHVSDGLTSEICESTFINS